MNAGTELEADPAERERGFGSKSRLEPVPYRVTTHRRATSPHEGFDLGVAPDSMLAYHVEWHMRQALAPLLFHDEALEADRARRDPVAPAKPSTGVSREPEKIAPASRRALTARHRLTAEWK